MTVARRRFLQLGAAAAAGTALPSLGWAQTFPNRPIRILIGFPPGGSSDVLARHVGQWLSDRLGQPYVVEHKPGASTKIAMQALMASPPDGHTLLLVPTTSAINASLDKSLRLDYLQDVAPVSGLVRFPLVLVAHPSIQASSVADLIARAKANPGKLNMASYGVGSTSHLAGAMFNDKTGITCAHVSYRGSAPALTDLIRGEMHFMFDVPQSALPHIEAGALRGLAVTTANRSAIMPGVPTVAETIPGFEASAWQGIAAPKGAPPAVIERLNGEIAAALADAGFMSRLAEQGYTPLPLSPTQFGEFLREESEKWAHGVRISGAKPE